MAEHIKTWITGSACSLDDNMKHLEDKEKRTGWISVAISGTNKQFTSRYINSLLKHVMQIPIKMFKTPTAPGAIIEEHGM